MFDPQSYDERLADLRERIDSGEPGLLSEYENLLKNAPEAPDPVMERLRVKRYHRPRHPGRYRVCAEHAAYRSGSLYTLTL